MRFEADELGGAAIGSARVTIPPQRPGGRYGTFVGASVPAHAFFRQGIDSGAMGASGFSPERDWKSRINAWTCGGVYM